MSPVPVCSIHSRLFPPFQSFPPIPIHSPFPVPPVPICSIHSRLFPPIPVCSIHPRSRPPFPFVPPNSRLFPSFLFTPPIPVCSSHPHSLPVPVCSPFPFIPPVPICSPSPFTPRSHLFPVPIYSPRSHLFPVHSVPICSPFTPRSRPIGSNGGVVEVQRTVTAVLGQDAELPCRYRAQEGEQVVQVTWLKRGPSGRSAELAVLDLRHGEHVQDAYVGRVRRRGDGALEDGGIVLRNAVQGDEGDYECHLITFPSGSFEGRVALRGIVGDMEGVGDTGTCGAEGMGDTGGTGDAGGAEAFGGRWVVGSHGTGGHVGQRQLIPPVPTVPTVPTDLSDASVLGHTEEWAEGMEGAALTCLGDGNPPPTYNWTRLDAPLPAGVRIKGDTLLFQRPLAAADAGDYVCRVANRVAAKEDEVRRVDLVSASVVVVGAIAAVLLCVLVVVVVVMTLYHKRKTKRISEKYEEELTLTRENSIRRLHSSHSTDTRTQLEETLQLRTESRQGSLRGDSLEEAEGRSYSTLSTVREIETQTEVPMSPLLPPSLEGKEVKEEEEEGGDNPIKQAMTHFVQENGMLQARPSTNGIYINGRGHLV
uniref:Nectin cell adhesion molecule 4 n=1 Tax=Coturnix japonica TaxID=93934 RepID=A0A8C2YCR5_COTJA